MQMIPICIPTRGCRNDALKNLIKIIMQHDDKKIFDIKIYTQNPEDQFPGCKIFETDSFLDRRNKIIKDHVGQVILYMDDDMLSTIKPYKNNIVEIISDLYNQMQADQSIGIISFKSRGRKQSGLLPCKYAYGCLFLERVFDYELTSKCDDQERTILHYIHGNKVLSSGMIIIKQKIDAKGGLIETYKNREQEQNQLTVQLYDKYKEIAKQKIKLEIQKSFRYWTIQCSPFLPQLENIHEKRKRYFVFYDKEINTGKGKSTISLTDKNKDWPKYNSFVQEQLQEHNLTFQYNTMTINCNVQSRPHLDNQNVGESMIIAYGDFEGGNLCVYDEETDQLQRIDIKNKWFKFNGSKKIHWTSPFKGQRTSIIIYNSIDLNSHH